MSVARVVIFVFFAGAGLFAAYLSSYGVGGASHDASKSIRERSAGGPGGGGGFIGRVK